MRHVAGGTFNHGCSRQYVKQLDFVFIGYTVVVFVEKVSLHIMAIRRRKIAAVQGVFNANGMVARQIGIDWTVIFSASGAPGRMAGAAILQCGTALGRGGHKRQCQ